MHKDMQVLILFPTCTQFCLRVYDIIYFFMLGILIDLGYILKLAQNTPHITHNQFQGILKGFVFFMPEYVLS